MKNSGLWIGLGIGLLIGAVVGAYLVSDDEEKAKLRDKINSKVDKAKETIGRMVAESLEELDKAAEKAGGIVKETISKTKEN